MIQKPAQKNGQKIIHDATSKTSSAEPQQQQQQRKGERPSHVQDVAKNVNGGHHHSASNGVRNGLVENGRIHLSNGSNGLAHASQNGNQGRQNGNAHGHANGKPVFAANGNGVPTRPQSQHGISPSAGAKSGGRPANPGFNGGNVAGRDGRQPVAEPAVQSAVGGGRGRDTGPSSGPHSNGGAAAVDTGAGVGGEGASGGRGKEPRRRGPRGRGGSEAVPASAEPQANGISNAAGGSGGGASERPPGKPGRARDRRPRGALQENSTADGNPAGEPSATADNNGDRAAADHDDQERGGQRSGRPRGRRGRGGQQSVAVDAVVEHGDDGQHTAPSAQAVAVGPDVQQQERPPRQPRQRPPKGPRPPSQNGAPESVTKDSAQAASADGQLPQNGVGKQPRKVREPRPPMSQQQPAHKQKTQDAEGGERDPSEVNGRGLGRSRGSRRRNGGGSDGGGAGVGSVEGAGVAEAGAASAAHADGDGSSAGRRQRPPRPPRQQPPPPPPPPPPQQQQQRVQPEVLGQAEGAAAPLVAEQPLPVPAVSHVPFQPQAAPTQGFHPPTDPAVQAALQSPPQSLMVQQQQPQPQYHPPQPYQDGQPLLDFSQQQQLLQHMLPQHHYPPLRDFQQQHFLQQHQFEPALQQFQQQMLQQHMAPPPAAGAHNYMPGPFNTPAGPMGGSGPMPPAFFGPGVNSYGQMLAPPQAPTFGSMPPGPPMQHASLALPPQHGPQHIGPHQDFLMGAQQPQQLLQQPQQSHIHASAVESAAVLEHQVAAMMEAIPAVHVAPPSEATAAVFAAAEPEVLSATTAAAATVAPPPPAADPVSEVPQAEPVKNEWADRLAQQALARMNAVKSSLISGTGGVPEDRSRSGGLLSRPYSKGSGGAATSPRGSPPATGNGTSALETESSWRGYGDSDNGARRNGGSVTNMPETWRNGSSSDRAPAGEAVNGWRASLAPTGAADAADAWRTRGLADEFPDAQAPASYQPPRREESPPPPPVSATSAASGRPRLNLQPRTKPLPVAPGNAATLASVGSDSVAAANGSAGSGSAVLNAGSGQSIGSRSSIFGAARPREEVLRERGVTEPERLTVSNVAYANGGSSVGSATAAPASRMGGGRAGSVTSGASDEDQWQTVGKGGRSKPPPTSTDVGNALLDATSDPFFTGRTTGVPVVGRSIPSGRPYVAGGGGGQYGSYGKGSYGSHGAGGDTFMNAYGASRGYGNTYGNDDEPIFKRGLPTRHDGLF